MATGRLIDVSDEELLVRTADEPEAFGVFYDRSSVAALSGAVVAAAPVLVAMRQQVRSHFPPA